MERLKRKEKCQLTEKFLQFGEGNFLRGFVDWMIDRLKHAPRCAVQPARA